MSITNNDPRIKDKREYDGSELTYTLINAIKEQQVEIDALKKKNEALQSTNQQQSAILDADHASLLTLKQQMEQLLKTNTTAGR